MSSASLSRSAMGSAPGDSTKMRGMALLLSLNAEASSKGGGSINWGPSCSAIKRWQPRKTCRQEVRSRQTASACCQVLRWTGARQRDFDF